MRARRLCLVALTALSLLAAACGSSSKASSSQPGGTPIKVGLMTGVQSNVISQPWTLQGAKIGAAAVNAAGGVAGRPVQIDFCDDHSTPQGAAICAQKLLIQDKVLMMVGDDGTQEPGLIPSLAAANTISWSSAGASQQSLQNPRVYILDPVEAVFWAMPQMFPSTVKRVVYLPNETAIAQQAVKGNEAYLPKSVSATSVTVPTTATSFQSYCLQIKQSGADTVVPLIDPGLVASLMQTCNQVGLTSQLWALASFELSPQVVRTVSDVHQPNLVTLGLAGGSILSQFQSDVATYGPKVGGITNTVAETPVNAWLGLKLLPKVVEGAGGVDAAKIKAWLDQQTAFDTGGATAPINFTATPIPQLPRLKNLSGTKAEIQDGKVVVTNPTPYVAHLPS